MVRAVHEYKTIGEKGFNFLTGPKDDHRRQVAMYAMAFDVPVTLFLYWCIANQELKEFPMAINFADWQYVENKIKQNEEYKSKGEPPPFELSAAKLNNIECAGDGNRYGPCKYYGVVCNPPPELLNIGARKRGK
jgi:hypothetical protein